MLNRRIILSGVAALILSGCTESAVETPADQSLNVVAVNVTISNFTGVTGRELSVSPAQVQSDVKAALESQLIDANSSGSVPATVVVDLKSVQLVSVVQSVSIGGASKVNATVSVVDAQGQALLAASDTIGLDRFVPGGLIGVANSKKTDREYATALQKFAQSVKKHVLSKDT